MDILNRVSVFFNALLLVLPGRFRRPGASRPALTGLIAAIIIIAIIVVGAVIIYIIIAGTGGQTTTRYP